MRNKWFGLLLTAGACASVMNLALPAMAGTSFGSLPGGTTFDGTGIATNAVEISTTTVGADTITLGLEGTPYGPGPGLALNNNGAGTYYATAGASPANPARSTWNYDFYIGVSSGDFSSYTYELVVTDGAASGSYDPTAAAVGDADINNSLQNSENLVFGPLPAYNEDASGVYNFDLEVFSGGTEVASDQINVDVAGVPDAANTFALTALTLGGLAFIARKKLASVSL